MMNEFDWDNVKEDLKGLSLDKFDNNYERACLHYFDLLRKIELKTLCTRVEIEELENNYQRAKRQTHRDSSQYNRMKEDCNMGSPEQQPLESFEFVCKVKNCSRSFQKKTSLGHHMMLIHNTPAVDFTKDKIFIIEHRDSQNDSARRGARH